MKNQQFSLLSFISFILLYLLGGRNHLIFNLLQKITNPNLCKKLDK